MSNKGAAPSLRRRDRERPLFSVTLADCDVQVFRSGGKGGQHQNTSDTGVRIVHLPSGAVGESRDTRSQTRNKRLAFERMVAHPKFRVWLNREKWVREGLPSAEELAEREMAPENIRVEVRRGGRKGRWVEECAGES